MATMTNQAKMKIVYSKIAKTKITTKIWKYFLLEGYFPTSLF